MNKSRQRRSVAPYRHTGRSNVGSPLLSILFFPAVFLYLELILYAFDESTSFFGMALLRIFLFSLASGLLLFLILDLLPWRKAARIAGGVIIVLWIILFCIERGCRNMFGLYYGISFMGTMAGDVVGDFGSLILTAVLGLIPFIVLSILPFAAYILLNQTILREEGQENMARIIAAAGMVICQLAGWGLSAFGGASNYYTYEYTATASVPHFGLVTCVRLELEYAVAGTPTPPLGEFIDPPAETAAVGPYDTGRPDGSAAPTDPLDPTSTPTQSPAAGPNVLDIDFEALAEAESDETIQNMHQYFGSLTPSEKNEYTGMFQGKNLVLLTAEGFSTYAIDQELTPTLYKLSHEGFVFSDFYQPDWTMSTTGGEFSVTTGLIPNWINASEGAPIVSVGNSMPYTLAHLFAPLGYSVPAWHNHTYTYYHRNEYLENFGYDYKAKDNGLELAHPLLWPESDLEMMEATCDSYIDGYVNNGTPFHAYYMTVSGHGKYTWAGNAMARKHQEAVQAKYPDMSEECQAYLACNMELDLALKHLVDKLEAAGIADDTLIVMAADHYPYLLVMDNGGPDYYNELRGFEDSEDDTSRYRSTLLMWSGAIKTPIEVDTPCSSIDIVPTICNLFGLKYDSRLYSGRDIFAGNYKVDQYSNCMPLVVFANKGKGNSWITAAGSYESATKTFTPNEGVTVDEDYVDRVKRLVAGKVNYSKLIVQEDYYKYVIDGGQ